MGFFDSIPRLFCGQPAQAPDVEAAAPGERPGCWPGPQVAKQQDKKTPSLAAAATCALLVGGGILSASGFSLWAQQAPHLQALRTRRQERTGSLPRLEDEHPLPQTLLLHAHSRASYHKRQAKLISDTAIFRGHSYFISNNHTFRGPWTEERFFDHWQAEEPDVRRLYLPVGWTGSELVNRAEWKRVNDYALSHFLADLDRSYPYFTVIQIAKGFENGLKLNVDVPADLDLTVFATGPTTATSIVPLPLLKEEMRPQAQERDILVSFTGTFSAHGSRQRARELYANRPGWVFEEPHAGWAQTASRSRFVLCPRGWGISSFRLYESLQLGAIPIYVHDDEGAWLPYSELVDWRSFSLVLHERDLPQLAGQVDALEAAGETARMLGRVSKLRHMWTYAFMNRYIVASLQEELHPPAAFAQGVA